MCSKFQIIKYDPKFKSVNFYINIQLLYFNSIVIQLTSLNVSLRSHPGFNFPLSFYNYQIVKNIFILPKKKKKSNHHMCTYIYIYENFSLALLIHSSYTLSRLRVLLDYWVFLRILFLVLSFIYIIIIDHVLFKCPIIRGQQFTHFPLRKAKSKRVNEK